VIWSQDGGDFSFEPHVLWANGYRRGVGWTGATRLEPEPGSADRPVAWLDAAQRVHVAWRLDRGGARQLRTALLDPATGWSPASDLAGTGADASGLVAVAASADDELLALWVALDANHVAGLWANRRAAGQGWGTPVGLDGGAATVDAPSFAADEHGDAVVVWTQRDTPDVSSPRSAWVNHFTVGSGWSGPTALEHDDAAVESARATIDPAGRTLAVWTQGGEPWEASLWSGDLAAASPASQPAVLTGGDGAHRPSLVVDRDGVATVAWRDARFSVWTRRFAPASGWSDATLMQQDPDAFYPPVQALAVAPAGHVALAATRDDWHLGVWRLAP
jgi:hypothetical protein